MSKFFMLFSLIALWAVSSIQAAEPTAQTLADQLRAARRDGNTNIRMRMDIKDVTGGPGTTLQLLIKSRRNDKVTEVVYQILWPRERKNEAILLRLEHGTQARRGWHYLPPAEPKALAENQWQELVFGSGLSYEDLVDDFYAWESQTLVASESVDGIPCHIVESKPGKASSSYASVRSWIDSRRMIPLRIEKYQKSGNLACRMTPTRIVRAENGQHVPASLLVQRSGQAGATEVQGSKIRRDVTYKEDEFSPAGLKAASP